MEHQLRFAGKKLAAGGTLLLAAILITACGASSASDSSEPIIAQATLLATALPTASGIASPTPIPTPLPSATATAPPPATNTPIPLTTATPMPPTPSATPLPTETPFPTATSPLPTLTFTPEPILPTDTATSLAVSSAELSTASQNSVDEGLIVYETTITLPTYPIRDFLTEQIDPVYNIPVLYFNRAAYDAVGPTPTPIDYMGVVLENPYLRLTFLPELGGRLYSAVVKATGQEIFYHNRVVKPSRYGILQPTEANWWLATGGLEWAYPTQEHGYRWGVPWRYEISEGADGVTIILSDTGPDRVGVEVAVTLPRDGAIFTAAPKLTNNSDQAVPVQFWINGALALTPGSMSPNTQFIVPVEEIIIHSRGATGWAVPEAHSLASWPQVEAVDLSDYSQWTDYLGFFVPDTALPFMGAYSPETDLGVVRLPENTVGNKLFAFSNIFFDRSYADDNSQYFEIWGGVNRGFWPEDDLLVGPGESLQWREHWWPLAQLGGLTWANQRVAISLTQMEGGYILSALFSQPQQGQLIINGANNSILSAPFLANPTGPLNWELDSAASPQQIQFMDKNGVMLLNYQVGQ